MSEIDHGAEARRWLEYAADDLRTAEFLLQQPDFARTVLEYVRGDLARHGLERGDVR